MVVINKIQEEILRLFPSVGNSDQFYLTGGTALAHFYLHHRKSRDLDFFTSTDGIIIPFSQILQDFCGQRGCAVERRRVMHSFAELQVSRGGDATLIHLAQDAAFRFEPTREFPEYPQLKVDNLTDIASNKLLALFGRAALRDFIDVYFLIHRSGFTKERLVELAQKKDPGFDLYWLGVAMTQINEFKQAALEDMLMLLEPVVFDDMAVFFSTWRSDIVKQLS